LSITQKLSWVEIREFSVKTGFVSFPKKWTKLFDRWRSLDKRVSFVCVDSLSLIGFFIAECWREIFYSFRSKSGVPSRHSLF